MDDSDAVKRLLDGTIEPSEIEGNPRLFAMAERIYGREALEELGVFAPEIERNKKEKNLKRNEN
mgnify:CR=1 FL=1